MKISVDFEQTISENCGAFGLAKARRLALLLENSVGSPIELHFVCALTSYIDGIDGTYIIAMTEEEAGQAKDFYIWPQKQIGKHRVDFLVGRVGASAVIVECDGRDFHHATREQIERDRDRDADLSREGWRVLRFPGTQIHNDPWKVIHDVAIAVDEAGWRAWWTANAQFIR